MSGINRIIVGCLTVCLSMVPRCGVRDLDPEAFVRVATDPKGPLCLTRCFSGFDMELYYRPASFYRARALARGREMDEKTAREYYGEGHHFVLRLCSRDSSNIEQRLIGRNIGSYSDLSRNTRDMLRIYEKVTLVTPAGEVRCLDAVTDRNWDQHTDLSMLLVFPAADTLKQAVNLRQSRLRVRDFGLNTGTVFFDLNRITSPSIRVKG